MDGLRDLRLADSLSSPTTLGIVTLAAMAVAAVYLTSHKARDSCSTAEQHQRAELYRRLSSVVLAGRHHVPCMLVDLEQFDRNAAAFVEITTRANKRIRVASKSIRVPYLIERFVRRHSEHVSGLMCFSWPEAAFLANECRLASLDMMVAYPTMLESDVELQLELIAQHGAHFHAMVDSLEHLALIERVCRQRRASHPDEQFKATVCIDVDMSYHVAGQHIGAHRSPIRSLEQFATLARQIRDSEYLELSGVMGYEAHISSLPDCTHFASRLFNHVASFVKSATFPHVKSLRRTIHEYLEREQQPVSFFNGGGSGSARLSCTDASITEVTVGSGLLQSHLFDGFVDCTSKPALYFALQVTRSCGADVLCCHSGGFIASGQTGADKNPLPFLPSGLSAFDAEGYGEVQTPLLAHSPEAKQLKIGDLVFLRPAKAGEIAERFSHYLIVQPDHETVLEVPTYRGRGQCFY